MNHQVAEKIRMERLRLNLSQQNMADELGITVAAYSNLERGVSDISLSRLYQIAKILKRDPYWFLANDFRVEDEAVPYMTSNQQALSHQVFMLIQQVQNLQMEINAIKTKIGF